MLPLVEGHFPFEDLTACTNSKRLLRSSNTGRSIPHAIRVPFELRCDREEAASRVRGVWAHQACTDRD
eukprot:scaffold143547_cov20-Tisochrysis_lutea.AAC.2